MCRSNVKEEWRSIHVGISIEIPRATDNANFFFSNEMMMKKGIEILSHTEQTRESERIVIVIVQAKITFSGCFNHEIQQPADSYNARPRPLNTFNGMCL